VGKRVADEYLDSIEEALVRLRGNTYLLRVKAEFSRHLRFYRVRRHFLVCSLIRGNTYLATLLQRRSRKAYQVKVWHSNLPRNNSPDCRVLVAGK